MMDWAGDLLGLSSAFSNASGVGGGVLQVCWIVLISFVSPLIFFAARPRLQIQRS